MPRCRHAAPPRRSVSALAAHHHHSIGQIRQQPGQASGRTEHCASRRRCGAPSRPTLACDRVSFSQCNQVMDLYARLLLVRGSGGPASESCTARMQQYSSTGPTALHRTQASSTNRGSAGPSVDDQSVPRHVATVGPKAKSGPPLLRSPDLRPVADRSRTIPLAFCRHPTRGSEMRQTRTRPPVVLAATPSAC